MSDPARPSSSSDPALELLDHCRGSLAEYKLPVDFHVVDALPRNPTGKIDKPAPRARLGSIGAAR
ncbi:hypothetical protein CP966_27935 [Streptomyces galilaeus]|nr:hypothetical protein CP966_27935 [Streptomyces galilaeus]